MCKGKHNNLQATTPEDGGRCAVKKSLIAYNMHRLYPKLFWSEPENKIAYRFEMVRNRIDI